MSSDRQTYEMEIPHFDDGNRRRRLLYIDEVIHWCSANCEDNWMQGTDSTFGHIVFWSERDAMAFKLRWL